MDIDLLAKMVKEAILDHDVVTLPGVGCFVAELVPSTFSDKGYTINPPYRRLYFSPKQGTDTYLADLYARDNAGQGVDVQKATRVLTEFLAEMKEVLKVKKTVVFPGLGRLRATRENHFFFVADEDLDIYPEGLGLTPLSLKTHVETPEEVATAVAGLAELISEPVEEVSVSTPAPTEPVAEPEPEKEPAPIEPVAEPEPEPEPEQVPEPIAPATEPVEPEPVEPEPAQPEQPQPATEPEKAVEPEKAPEKEPEKALETVKEPVKEPEPEEEPVSASPRRKDTWRKVGKIALISAGVLAALLLLVVLLGRVAPELLDPLLYSKEELNILRY